MDIKSMPYDRLQEYVVEELHEKASEPGFWDDMENSQKCIWPEAMMR